MAKRTKGRPGNAIDLDVRLPSDRQLKEMFDAVPMLRRHDVMNAATRAAADVVVKAARKEAPRSKPEDMRRQSRNTRARFQTGRTPLWKTVKRVVRRGNTSSLAVIGPEYPDGNIAYFNQPRAGQRRHVFWGNDKGRMYIVRRNWLAIAFDLSKPTQLNKMKQVIRQKLDEMWLHV